MSYYKRWSNYHHRHHRHRGPRSRYSNWQGTTFNGRWGDQGAFASNQGRMPSAGAPGQGSSTPVGKVGRYANLENNLPLPQGWQRPNAMPTSISSLITSLLYQSRQDPQDYWNRFFNMGRSSNGGYSGGTSGAYSQPYGSQGYDSRYYQGSGSGGQGNNLSQSTMEALQLADAYFSPKRLELAYSLGDMETDMQRLSVNLGRQVDDPILQAKLYKEAMKSVRSLDSEQNTFALQMTEQRRKEEIANDQFYQQLQLQYDQMQQQAYQFEENLSMQQRQLNKAQ